VARAAGCSESTVAAGVAEIEAGEREALPPGRSRRPGGGRKKAEEAQPGLKQALAGLLEAVTRGDPMVHVTWCSLSLREIGREMAARGFRCGRDALARMMHQDGYSLQGMSRTAEGKQHPDRDAQFRHIDAMITGFRAAGDPVVSVDGKKKEQLGPYGVYDIAANRGFVSVGTSRDTAAFAVSLSNFLCKLGQSLSFCYITAGSFRRPGQTGTRSGNVTANAFMASFQPRVPVPRCPLSRTS